MTSFTEIKKGEFLEARPSYASPLGSLVTFFRRFSNISKEQRALQELSHLTDYELADIGLSRSDLSPDGLRVAGTKRAATQEVILKEMAIGLGQTPVKRLGN